MVQNAENWYRDPENWHGSFVEVAIEFGPRDDARLLRGFQAAWAHETLKGPKESPYGDPPRVIDESLLDPDKSAHTYGTIAVPNGATIGCEVLAVRDDDSDWLDIAIPTGMLELVYKVSYPLMFEANPWIEDVERRLVDIADRIYEAVPFDLATVGEETSGIFYANPTNEKVAISREAVGRGGGFLLSPGLWDRLDPEAASQRLASGLRWVPSTGRGWWTG